MKILNKKTVILATVILLIGVITCYFLLNKEDKLQEVSGKIIVIGEDYVIIESDNKDYTISNTKGNYKLGDEVKFIYKESNLDDTTSPIRVFIEKEELLKENPNTEMEIPSNEENINNNNIDNNANSNNNSNSNNITNNQNNIDSNNSNNETLSIDEEVITYFNNLKADIDSSNIKEDIKSSFVTMVDFLFYDGEIKGHTFDELSSSAKLEVLKIALYIDDKIETLWPGYKESISSTTSRVYTSVKGKVVELYLDITTSICKDNEDICTTAKEDFNNMKKSFGFTWELIKSLAGSGLEKLQNWYEIWKEE